MSRDEEPTSMKESPCMRLCGQEQPDTMCLIVKTCPIAVSYAERMAREKDA
ncbi:MAG: hypothetical protein PHV74_13805 [Dehalococcoidia bacterium]|nr:hypothetical protein [Dehalococcoidia bacterium]